MKKLLFLLMFFFVVKTQAQNFPITITNHYLGMLSSFSFGASQSFESVPGIGLGVKADLSKKFLFVGNFWMQNLLQEKVNKVFWVQTCFSKLNSQILVGKIPSPTTLYFLPHPVSAEGNFLFVSQTDLLSVAWGFMIKNNNWAVSIQENNGILLGAYYNLFPKSGFPKASVSFNFKSINDYGVGILFKNIQKNFEFMIHTNSSGLKNYLSAYVTYDFGFLTGYLDFSEQKNITEFGLMKSYDLSPTLHLLLNGAVRADKIIIIVTQIYL